MPNTESRCVQTGLFSAVSSAFIIDVQSKLEPDPNETTAAYMRILIHNMNNSLFPDSDPSSITWTSPPPEIVTVQSLLYASLVTSLFAAFLAMLGKQWVNRYLRNRGGSAADKCRDRQRKLDGLEKWHFHIVIESLPVMLQLALLLLGCALSLYLRTISHTVAGIVIAGTLLGVTSYVFLTLAATLHYNCPYQVPPSLLIRALIKYLACSNTTFAHSLRSLTKVFPSIKDIRQTFRLLCTGVYRALEGSGCIPSVPDRTEHIPLAVITSSLPPRIFEDVSIDWEVCKAETRCISWILSTTTDIDVIYSTVRFAADMVWYPEIVGALSPNILTNLFLDCLLDGQPIPGKSQHASSIGMALASVLSTQFTIEPENQTLVGLCKHIHDHIEGIHSPEPMFVLVVRTLRFIVNPQAHQSLLSCPFWSAPENLPITQKLWLSKIVLQTIWRMRRVKRLIGVHELLGIELFCKTFTKDSDTLYAILKTNSYLIMAISLGLQINIHDLHAPNNKCVVPLFFHGVYLFSNSDALQMAVNLFFEQLQISIMGGKAESGILDLAISTLCHLDPPQTMETREHYFLWLAGILKSGYPDSECCLIASGVVQLIGKQFDYTNSNNFPPNWIHPLLDFLLLCEKLSSTKGFTALHILSSSPPSSYFDKMILPLLMPILLPAHPLQLRSLALKIFYKFTAGWFSSHVESIPYRDLNNLLQAIGDPLLFSDLPLQDGQVVLANYKPMMAMVLLIEFASSDLWRSHLCYSNFTSCEEFLSTEEGRSTAVRSMLDMAIHSWSEFLCTPAKIITAIRCFEELQCLNMVEAVLFWAWTVGVVNATDHDGWGLIEQDTLNFYQTHGMSRLATLSQHIMDTSVEDLHLVFLLMHYKGQPCRVGSVQQSVPFQEARRQQNNQNLGDLHIAQACQLRRLYQVFVDDPMMWKEVVDVEEAGGQINRSLSWFAAPLQFMDWACDYP